RRANAAVGVEIVGAHNAAAPHANGSQPSIHGHVGANFHGFSSRCADGQTPALHHCDPHAAGGSERNGAGSNFLEARVNGRCASEARGAAGDIWVALWAGHTHLCPGTRNWSRIPGSPAEQKVKSMVARGRAIVA